MEWHCYKCKQEVEEVELEYSYIDLPGFIKSLRCPKCGAVYLNEEAALEMLTNEDEIEAKLI